VIIIFTAGKPAKEFNMKGKVKGLRVFGGIVFIGLALVLLCAASGGGGNNTAGKASSAAIKALEKEDAAAFTEVLKDAGPEVLSILASTASPGGDFTYELVDYSEKGWGEGIRINSYTGSSATVIYPAQIENYPVIEIVLAANRAKPLSLVIPEGVKALTAYEYLRGSIALGVQSVVLPDSLAEIGSGAFARAAKLVRINFPAGLTKLGQGAFGGCGLLNVDLSGTALTEIAAGSFSACSSLRTVKLPDSLTTIWGGAFGSCRSLTNINIPPNIQFISDAAFESCGELFNLAIPDSLTSIAFVSNRTMQMDFVFLYGILAGIEEISSEDVLFKKYLTLKGADLEAFITPYIKIVLQNEQYEQAEFVKIVSISGEVYEVDQDYRVVQYFIRNDANDAFRGCGKLPVAARKRLQELGYHGEF
jgi:hypothetical protein